MVSLYQFWQYYSSSLQKFTNYGLSIICTKITQMPSEAFDNITLICNEVIEYNNFQQCCVKLMVAQLKTKGLWKSFISRKLVKMLWKFKIWYETTLTNGKIAFPVCDIGEKITRTISNIWLNNLGNWVWNLKIMPYQIISPWKSLVKYL